MVRAISSAGEHYIDIVGVTGSIPVSPTILAIFTSKAIYYAAFLDFEGIQEAA